MDSPESIEKVLKKGKKAVQFTSSRGRIIITKYNDYKKGVLSQYPCKSYFTSTKAEENAKLFLGI